MQNLMIMPASPALAEELSPSDDASRALLSAACELARDAARVSGSSPLQVDIVGSRDVRWRTEHTGSLKAWGSTTGQCRRREFPSGNHGPLRA